MLGASVDGPVVVIMPKVDRLTWFERVTASPAPSLTCVDYPLDLDS